MLVLGAGALAVLAIASSFLSRQAPGTGALIGGTFSLVDDHGGSVTERSFPGKYLLVYFGYAACPDICPETLNTLAASFGRLGRKADLVQPLFITIDPAHDTPAVLRRYVGGFSSKLVGLTGSEREVSKVADEYHVVRTPHAGNTPRLDHSAVLYLMGPDGRFIAPIPADASEGVMAGAIARYVS
jgi:protein SCO1/2